MTGQIYVDKTAPKSIQAQAQGFITLITYGVGMLIGTNLAGIVVNEFTTPDAIAWKQTWLVPAALAGGILLLFAFMFNDKKTS